MQDTAQLHSVSDGTERSFDITLFAKESGRAEKRIHWLDVVARPVAEPQNRRCKNACGFKDISRVVNPLQDIRNDARCPESSTEAF